MSARTNILGRLGADPLMPAARVAQAQALVRAVERPEPASTDSVAAFLSMLGAPSVSASHDHIASLAALPGAVAAYLDGAGLPHTLCLPPDPRLDACDWSSFTLHDHAAPDEAAALTLARHGVAETGSLVFETGPHAPMLPGFLSLHALVLLRTADIVPHLEDAPPSGAPCRAYYWVTGVSGTTDIEGQYVRGAHGPRYLHVILLD